MTPYVVDASIVIKWFVDEVHAEAARRLEEDQYELSAPDLLWSECGNILWKKVRRRELTPDEARFIWGGLEQQPISAFPSRLVLDLALEVAFDTNRTVYVLLLSGVSHAHWLPAGNGRSKTLQRLAGRQLCHACLLGGKPALMPWSHPRSETGGWRTGRVTWAKPAPGCSPPSLCSD